MKVFFRTDSSGEIGSGHVMRCLTLAAELARRGITVEFICRAHPDGLSRWIRGEKGFSVTDLPVSADFVFKPVPGDSFYAGWLHERWERDAELTYDAVMTRGGGDWLITDHYALDERWESRVKGCVKKTLVIDDLADRKHSGDALLDQNYFRDPQPRYDAMLPSSCVRLLGPRFALIRQEFSGVPPREIRPRVENVVVFFGAGDPAGLVARTLNVLKPLAREFGFTTHALVGSLSPHGKEVKNVARGVPGCHVHEGMVDMAGLLKAADVFIGAGGTVTWERAALGLPAVIVSAAANQNPFSKDLAAAGVQTYLGPAAGLADERFAAAVREILSDPLLRRRYAENSRALVDGLGTARVADFLMGMGRARD